MIGDGSGVANMRSVRRWSAVLALAGAVAAPSAAPAQTPVPMEFPPPGTRWITRTIDRSGGSHLTTYTVLEPGAFRGQPAFRVSDAVGTQFYERAGQLSTGDELIGLQRAFLYAGTPAVVTTLWKVDDRASFVLMREFYDGLAKADTGLALQAAQRAAMKEFPHPFAWAAFGLTGVGR
jgi:hypothetical protein